jgi:hypothetical protein
VPFVAPHVGALIGAFVYTVFISMHTVNADPDSAINGASGEMTPDADNKVDVEK